MKNKIRVVLFFAIFSFFIGCINTVKAAQPQNVFGNTNGNIYAGGIAATDGNNVYYSDMRHLYKQPAKGGKAVLIDSSKSKYEWIDKVNALNNTVYYLNGGTIVKYSGGKKSIINKKSSVLNMLVAQNRIFFVSHETVGYKAKMNVLFSTDLSGKELKTISETTDDVSNIFYYNNKLYYNQDNVSTGNVLCELDLKAKQFKSKNIMTISGNYLNVESGWVYYKKYNNNTVFRKKLVGGSEETVLNLDNKYTILNITKDCIYSSVNIGEEVRYDKYSLIDGVNTLIYKDTIKLNGYDWVYAYFSIINDKIYYVSNIYDFNSKIKIAKLSSSNDGNKSKKSVNIDEAKQILEKYDSKFSELVVADKQNTAPEIFDMLSKEYYMFLPNYEDDKMYLVKKDTGEAFYMKQDMVIKALTKANK